MLLPTFSDFAKLLYPYCGDGENQSDFVVTLTNKIMAGRPGREKGGRHKNPFIDKETRDLNNYFKGSRPIPQRDAGVLLGNIDKYRFEQYINMCSDGALLLIEDDLNKLLESNATDSRINTAARCADLFEKILIELAFVQNQQ